MPTANLHRLIIVCPVGAKQTAIVTWMQTNIGATSVPSDLGPGLSATGSAPATFVWCNGSYTDAQAKAILSKLCQLSSVATPTVAQWDNATGAQKRTWWNSVRATIATNYGVWCQLADNTGVWDDPAAALTARGLKVIASVP